MKTFAIAAAVLTVAWSSSARADDQPSPTAAAGPAAPDAPVLEAPLVILPDGSLAKGRSMRIAAGMTAPFAGQLIDDQEHTRREKINERNAAKVGEYEAGGNITMTKGQLIAIVAGVGVACAAATTGIILGVQAQKKPGQP